MAERQGFVPFASLQETARARKPNSIGFLFAFSECPLFESQNHCYQKNIKLPVGSFLFFWRRDRDSNPATLHREAVSSIKKLLMTSSIFVSIWRRDRDSNPGYLAARQFSRLLHSTTLPSLRVGRGSIGKVGYLSKFFARILSRIVSRRS